MHDAHRGKGMEVQSPLPPLHSYRIPFQMATKVPINANRFGDLSGFATYQMGFTASWLESNAGYGHCYRSSVILFSERNRLWVRSVPLRLPNA
jgi:hypothetical protein